MTMPLLVLGVSIFVTLAVCFLFVFHPEYEAGVLGSLGLTLIALVALSRLDAMIADPHGTYLAPRSLLMWVGVALFFGQLAWRFMKRMRSARNCADWRCGKTGRIGR